MVGDYPVDAVEKLTITEAMMGQFRSLLGTGFSFISQHLKINYSPNIYVDFFKHFGDFWQLFQHNFFIQHKAS